MLRLVYTEGQFVAQSDFKSRGIPREAGFSWCEKTKRWVTKQLGVAVRLREYADHSAENRIRREMIQVSPWSGRLPHPKHLTPYPYQKDPAATFALSRNRSYLGLAPRLGKTVVSALVRNALDAPAVFITPPFLTRTIEAEFNAWSVGGLKVVRYEPGACFPQSWGIVIVPDSIIHREEVRDGILDMAEDLGGPILFVDEAHRYKSPDAARTKSLLGAKGIRGLIKSFDRVVFLSGTPMLNRPIELYPILRAAAPETIDFMTRVEYGMKYCAGHLVEETCPKCFGRAGRNCRYCKGQGGFKNGYDFSGASNLDELRSRIHGKFMLRMETVEGLPPTVEEMVILGERPPKLAKMEQAILAKHSPEDLVAGTVSSDHVATYRKELGKIKVKPAIDFIRSLLEDGEESILVFAFHREVVQTLAEKLKKFRPLVIQGGVSNAERDAIQKEFQSNAERRLFIGNYVAAGLGLRLSKANRVVMVEYSWTPAENRQAADRANAVNAGKAELLVQYLVLENSLDRKVIEANLRKKRVTSFI